jgi:hypothetical protein
MTKLDGNRYRPHLSINSNDCNGSSALAPVGPVAPNGCQSVGVNDLMRGLRARGRPLRSAVTPAHTCLMRPALRAPPPSLGHLVTPAHGLPSPPEWLNRGPASPVAAETQTSAQADCPV